ncbi:MAG: hypothetical protein RRY10_00530 [Christensenellaceae bacterium]
MTYANHILQRQAKKPKTLSNLRMLGAEQLLLVRMIDTSVCGLWHATVNAYWKMAGDVSWGAWIEMQEQGERILENGRGRISYRPKKYCQS